MKTVTGSHGNNGWHWVRDFPVRSLFSYDGLGGSISPFLLLDIVGPHSFALTSARLGVGQHPHRGFETVSIVSAVTWNIGFGWPRWRHRAGDVQWMTAGDGILHEEYLSSSFAKSGGSMRMVQFG